MDENMLYQELQLKKRKIKEGKTYRLKKENEILLEKRYDNFKEKYPHTELTKSQILNHIVATKLNNISDKELLEILII